MTHKKQSLVKCLDLTPKNLVVIGKRRILWRSTANRKGKFENFESSEEKCLQYTSLPVNYLQSTAAECSIYLYFCAYVCCVWLFVMPRFNTLPISHLIGSGSIRCRFMLSLFRKNPHRERYLSQYFSFPLTVTFIYLSPMLFGLSNWQRFWTKQLSPTSHI